jgi:hypothetical protein
MKRGRLLVANVNEPDLVAPLPQGLHHAVDAVAGQPEHDLDAPFVKPAHQDVRGRRAHEVSRRGMTSLE